MKHTKNKTAAKVSHTASRGIVSARFPVDLLADMKKASAALGLSLSAFTALAAREHLKRNKF